MNLPQQADLATGAALEDEPYDDTQDHDRCPDCKGSGTYVGFLERSHCRTCDGSGWI